MNQRLKGRLGVAENPPATLSGLTLKKLPSRWVAKSNNLEDACSLKRTFAHGTSMTHV